MANNDHSPDYDDNVEITCISRDNPYVRLATEDEDIDEETSLPIVNATFSTPTRTVFIAGINNGYIEVPVDIAEKALKIQSMSKGIKCICYIDLFFNLFYMMYGYLLGMIFAFASISGIYSTYNQSRSMLSYYLCYQYIICISKLTTAIFYTCMLNSSIKNSFHEQYPTVEFPESIPTSVAMSTLLFIMQVYIANYVRTYYYLLPNKNEDKIIIAKATQV